MNNLKAQRKKLGLTQAELAKTIGATQGMITGIETGKRSPSYEVALKLAETLHTTVDYLSGSPDLITLPVLGKVAGGEAIYAEEDIEGYEEFHIKNHKGRTLFALRVVGKSMEPVIGEGSKVVIEQDNFEPESDKVYLVMIDNSATIKCVEYQDKGLMLTAYNTEVYKPHFYTREQCEAGEVRILGRVIQVVRDL